MELTQIQKFYKNTNVFITGGTGFMGKILIEKLLRSTEVDTLYILIREKKGKSMHVRIDELFDHVIFSRLKKECPKFKHRVEGVTGDCQLSGLGLSITDRQTLISKVDIVFHVAATVRFDENLKLAYDINVNGTKYMLDLARQMTHLKSVVHVSTAYSNCPIAEIDEKIYDCPISYEDVNNLLQKVSKEEADLVTPRILGKWPNTYTFTKALAENLINDVGRGLPVAIFRPSIVVSTYKEPLEGWIDNLYGPTGICAGAITGVVRTALCDSQQVADVVPVDTCVAGLIASAWDVSSKKVEPTSEIPVYNYISSSENPVRWDELVELNVLHKNHYPATTCIWESFVVLTSNINLYWFLALWLHTIPGLLIDFFAILIGHKPRMLGMYKKINKFNIVLSFFSTKSWKFSNKNVRNLWTKLDERDKELFPLSIKTVHWLIFFRSYLLGIRRYLLNDPDSTLEEAKKRQRRLYFVHNLFKYLLIFIACNVILTLLSKLVSSVF